MFICFFCFLFLFFIVVFLCLLSWLGGLDCNPWRLTDRRLILFTPCTCLCLCLSVCVCVCVFVCVSVSVFWSFVVWACQLACECIWISWLDRQSVLVFDCLCAESCACSTIKQWSSRLFPAKDWKHGCQRARTVNIQRLTRMDGLHWKMLSLSPWAVQTMWRSYQMWVEVSQENWSKLWRTWSRTTQKSLDKKRCVQTMPRGQKRSLKREQQQSRKWLSMLTSSKVKADGTDDEGSEPSSSSSLTLLQSLLILEKDKSLTQTLAEHKLCAWLPLQHQTWCIDLQFAHLIALTKKGSILCIHAFDIHSWLRFYLAFSSVLQSSPISTLKCSLNLSHARELCLFVSYSPKVRSSSQSLIRLPLLACWRHISSFLWLTIIGWSIWMVTYITWVISWNWGLLQNLTLLHELHVVS